MKKHIAISLFSTAVAFHSTFAQAGEPVGHGLHADFPIKAKVAGDETSGQEFTAVALGEHGKVSCSLYLPKEKEDRDLNTQVTIDVDRVTESPATTNGYVAYIDGTFSVGGQLTHASMACAHPDPELGTPEFLAYLQALVPASTRAALATTSAAPAPVPASNWQKTVIDILPADIGQTPAGTSIAIDVAPSTISPRQESISLRFKSSNPRPREEVYEGELTLHIPGFEGGQRNFPGGRIEVTLTSRPERSYNSEVAIPGAVKINGALVEQGGLFFSARGNLTIETLKDFIENNGGTFTLGPWNKDIDDGARRQR